MLGYPRGSRRQRKPPEDRMSAPFVIDRQFNGPATSGNAGYVGGRLAAELEARHGKAQAVQVTLRAPLTLDAPLQVIDRPDGSVPLLDGDTLLAEGLGTDVQPDVPRPPSLEEARAASAIGRMRMTTRSGNAYLHCFGCGLAKGEHEGLRITPTPAGEADQVAAEWIPDEAFADENGLIPPGVV